ncbi:ABC transporter ATP-binding protein [bacterium]|nr:ABC transporter ATP-binding protein [candidate division CSSED10-310 bacterium]
MFTIIRQFLALMGRQRKTYFLAGAALMVATGFQLAFPWVLKRAVDAISAGSVALSYLAWLSGLLFAAALLEGVFTYLKSRWSALAAEGTVRDLRNRIFRRLMLLPFTSHNDMESGDMIQRATSDIQTIQRFLANQVAEVARTICLLVGVSALLFTLHRTLAMYSLTMLPLIFGFSFYFFGKIRDRFERFDKAEATVTSRLQEHLSGVRVVKAFAREAHEMSLFTRASEDMAREDIKLARLHAIFWPASDLLCMLQVVLVLLAGGLKVLSGEISLGAFVAFNTYIMYLVWPVRQVGRLLGEMGRASVSLRRIREILGMPEERLTEGAGADGEFRGAVEFRDVGFSYGRDRILRDISFRVEPGQTVAVLGATGAGKTTMMHLLGRYYDDYDGAIYIGGRELRRFTKQEVRSRVGIVLQEPFLFSRSLRENIAFGAPGASHADIRAMAVLAAVDEVIGEFPDGYETMVGERGVTLSGGQKQRVALARTLLAHTPILILDDTTSALDSETEAAVCAAIRGCVDGRTTFIITHRLSTAAGADRILVLDQGRLVQDGSHEELIACGGIYRSMHERLCDRQAQLKKELRHDKAWKYRAGIRQAI